MLLEEFSRLQHEFERLKDNQRMLKNLFCDKEHTSGLELISVKKTIPNVIEIVSELEGSITKLIAEMNIFFFDLSKAYPQMNLEDVVKMIRSQKPASAGE